MSAKGRTGETSGRALPDQLADRLALDAKYGTGIATSERDWLRLLVRGDDAERRGRQLELGPTEGPEVEQQIEAAELQVVVGLADANVPVAELTARAADLAARWVSAGYEARGRRIQEALGGFEHSGCPRPAGGSSDAGVPPIAVRSAAASGASIETIHAFAVRRRVGFAAVGVVAAAVGLGGLSLLRRPSTTDPDVSATAVSVSPEPAQESTAKAPVPLKVRGEESLRPHIRAIRASSFTNRVGNRHPPEDAFDRNPATAWNESVPGPGRGEWIEVEFDVPVHVEVIRMATGWDYVSPQHGDLFEANAHIKTVRFEFDSGVSGQAASRVEKTFPAATRSATIDVDATNGTVSRLRITAVDVYEGKKWQDLCLSDIEIEGRVLRRAPTATDAPPATATAVPVPNIPCTSFATCNAACEAGALLSCAATGEMLQRGTGGAVMDEARGYALFVRACQGGELAGCVNAGWAELAGKGTPKDGAKALKSFELACVPANSHGCYGVGVVLRGGFGPPKDFERAGTAFGRACGDGQAVACKAKEQLERVR